MGVEQDKQRLRDARHAMQSGVASKMHYDVGETSPKHLRVGVNSAMVSHRALVKLLTAKGVITEEEYFAAAADAMQDEVTLYEAELKRLTGANVTLH